MISCDRILLIGENILKILAGFNFKTFTGKRRRKMLKI